MPNHAKSILAAAGLLLALAAPVAAQSGADGVFQIHNDTDANTVVGFYTNDGSGWSSNWLGSPMKPGAEATAEFNDNTGSCEQTFRVGWLGADGGEVLDDPIDINICEASNVYLGDNEITFD